MITQTIFISIPWFTPAFKAGGPIQSIANMVDALHEGYQFYIYTSNEDLNGQPIAVAHVNMWIDYNAYTKVWYSGRQDRSQHLIEQVQSIKPDVLYIVGLFDWHFNIVPMLFAKAARKILSVRGMLHPGALSQKPFKKRLFIQAMKWMKADKKISFQATDEAEAVFIKNVFKNAELNTAGNFPRILAKQKVIIKQKGYLKMVSVGIISPMKNYALVLEALLHIKDNIEYTIYGPVKETAYWEECLKIIQSLPPHIKVDYQKELPAYKVPLKLENNHVFILPSKSENYGHAIAEALSAGLPVITSNNVPWLNLKEAVAGMNVATTVTDVQNCIEFFAEMDEQEYNKYCEGAYTYIRTKLDIPRLKKEYDRIFDV